MDNCCDLFAAVYLLCGDDMEDDPLLELERQKQEEVRWSRFFVLKHLSFWEQTVTINTNRFSAVSHSVLFIKASVNVVKPEYQQKQPRHCLTAWKSEQTQLQFDKILTQLTDEKNHPPWMKFWQTLCSWPHSVFYRQKSAGRASGSTRSKRLCCERKKKTLHAGSDWHLLTLW